MARLHLLARAVAVSVAALSLAGTASAQDGPLPCLDPDLPIPQRVQDLLGRMTLDQKFWQLFMVPGSLDDPAHDWSMGSFGMQVSDAPAASDHGGTVVGGRAPPGPSEGGSTGRVRRSGGLKGGIREGPSRMFGP